jgi:radical SAM-linked protein
VIADLDDQPTEPRQRWRFVFERDADAPEPLAPGSAVMETFIERLAGAGLIVARSGNRPRLSVAAPLPIGISGDRELADLFVTARQPIALVRGAIEDALPVGHRLVDLHDAWLGEPTLAAQLEAADYRVQIEPVGGGAAALAGACRNLLEAESLPRTRTKGSRDVTYDLRPLLADVRAIDAGSATVLEIRTRFNPERGAGRLDEVLAAISEAANVPVTARDTRRTRLWLASELAEAEGAPSHDLAGGTRT